jgi:myo-inositol-1(or 4)-monophosphatase
LFLQICTCDFSIILEIYFFFQGVRRLGSAAADMSHIGLGITEAYWEYRLKPWDMAAGVLVVIVTLSPMGILTFNKYFSKSVLINNHEYIRTKYRPLFFCFA